jgi:hypothetical protein
MGERIKIKVLVDNSHVKKDLKISVCLQQKITLTGVARYFVSTGEFSRYTEPSVINHEHDKAKGQLTPAHQILDQVIELTIPTEVPLGFCPPEDAMPNSRFKVTDEEKAQLQKPSPTYKGSYIVSEYAVVVTYKYKAINDRGTDIEIPITVYQA